MELEHDNRQGASSDRAHTAGHPDGALAADNWAAAPAPYGESDDADTSSGPTPMRNVVQAMVFPLFFVVMFAFCYVSAFHHPTPHDVGLVIVGPDSATSLIAAQLSESSPGSFDVSTSTDVAGPLADLASQKTSGVIEVGNELTVHVASGGGSIVSQSVERVAQGIASSSGLPLTIADVAPLTSGDSTGTALFYFLIIATIGGYLTITVLSQVAPTMSISRQLRVLGVMGVLLTLVAFGISSIFVGGYGATLPALLIMILVGIVYSITIGMVSIVFNKLLGQAAIFVVMTFAIFVNFPSSGGAIPAQFLPAFWEAVHSFWIGSGAMQSIRSVIYFDGSGLGHGLVILGAWIIVAAVALFAVSLREKNKPDAAADANDAAPVSAVGSSV